MLTNAVTFDIEDYFQCESFKGVISKSDWDFYQLRVEDNTNKILSVLNQHSVTATFFILGWIADRVPNLIEKIAEDGHEIATHGYEHSLVYTQTMEEFESDVSRSLSSLRAILGQNYPILGYRAPTFSITNKSRWAIQILKDLGLKYDSSIFPIQFHDNYGVAESPRVAYQMQEGIWEIPLSTVRIAKRNWPVAGGGYFRLFPLAVTKWAIKKINHEGNPAVIYLHPWEFDPNQPRISDAPAKSKFRHYLNIGKTEYRLSKLLTEFRCSSIQETFAHCLNDIQL